MATWRLVVKPVKSRMPQVHTADDVVFDRWRLITVTRSCEKEVPRMRWQGVRFPWRRYHCTGTGTGRHQENIRLGSTPALSNTIATGEEDTVIQC